MRAARAVLALGLLTALVLAVPGAADASHGRHVRHHTSGHGSRHHSLPHNCQGFRHAIPHAAVWTGTHSERSTLAVNIGKLICSAGRGSTIDLKSWFFKINDKFTESLVEDLRIMHRYHRVKVHVFVGRNARGVDWSAFREEFDFAYLGWCRAACKAPDASGVSHSKWITVSRLRNGLPAVLSTSANWSRQQFTQVDQSGIFVSGNRTLYRDFVDRWDIYQHCFEGYCDKTVGASGWESAGYFAVHFAPSTNDAIADELSTVTCGHSGHVYIASLFFYRPEVLAQLKRLIGTGCDVRVLLSRPFTSYTARVLDPRHLHQHDKYVVVWTGNRHEVMAGSEDLATHEMVSDDNQMIRARLAPVVRAYDRLFDGEWHDSRRVPRSQSVAHVDVRETS